MKPIRLPKVTAPVPVTNFPSPPAPPLLAPPMPPPPAGVERDEAPLPPPPPQINKPVGPPPPTPDLSLTEYEEYVELTKKVVRGQGPSDKAQIWAMLAHAAATNRLADRFEEFLDFMGAQGDDDDAPEAPRFRHEVADGLFNGFGLVKAAIVKEALALIPPELKGQFEARVKESLAELQGDGAVASIFKNAVKLDADKP